MSDLKFDEAAVRAALKVAWSVETAVQWTKENPASGQCNVTAAVVHDLFGGAILRTQLPGVLHYYNQFAGQRVDLTDSQFSAPGALFEAPDTYDDEPTDRGAAMEGIPEAEYNALRSALLAELGYFEGGCDCGTVRYRLTSPPMFVHCCHCTWCQRETGSAFALNALIEADRVPVLTGEPELVDTPSASGQGQKYFRCPKCRIAVWSNYSSEKVRFVRVGTLDAARLISPDIHIFTSSKQPWGELGDQVPIVPEFYDRAEYWPADSYARLKALDMR